MSRLHLNSEVFGLVIFTWLEKSVLNLFLIGPQPVDTVYLIYMTALRLKQLCER